MSASNLLRVFALFLALTIPGLASADDVRVKTLRFAKGATSVTQKGSIKGPMSVKYQLTAKAGQVLTVKLISNKGQSYFNVRAPNDGEALFTGATAGTNEWSGRLTEKGRYSVQVLLAPAAAQRNEVGRYTVTFSIVDAAKVATAAP
ncbi:MAG: DNA breaking-rejoining protein [Betaproteobacteria bacterium]|nr:DNA breaking-rejoining protein [Betaproteobacteria bacterium]MBK6601721.1 DNA breaking-rejoining protein [Betaproteobacteria bacterium]MBK7082486.1 DNA breaking-rejoining protein [Betaproteobacteria bacterium]MBK7591320.1 DNA breaking-rejoining protein [Betaproteobacteria bacterium]MBK7744247.1 DNA breaking-rejoining protein [Betaproteobacteria bacterium]